MADVPRDISEHFQTGSAVTAAYQTSGVQQTQGVVGATAGQGDSYTVVTSPKPLDDAGMHALMDRMHAATAAVDNGSTGVIASVSQKGQGSFEVTAGSRGDSQVSLIRIGADNAVTVTNLIDDRLPMETIRAHAGNDFGSLGTEGGNYVHTEKVTLAPGERAIVLTASDGLSDSYVGKPAGQFAKDIEAYVKANPDSPDISRFLTERATALGAQDNTTIVTTQLTADTDLKGKSVTTAVFDGVGHTDGRLSSQLARTLEAELPGATKPAPVAHTEIDHVSTRADDLARAKDPAAKDPHAEAARRTIDAGEPAKPPPKPDEPKSDGEPAKPPPKPDDPKSDGEPAKPPPKPDDPKGAGEPAKPPPKPADSDTGKPAQAPPKPDKSAGGGEPAKPPSRHVITPPKHPVSKTTQAKLGHGTAAAQVAVALAKGDVATASVTATQAIALNAKTYEAAAGLTRNIAPVAKGLGFVAKKVPVIGAVVTAGFVLHEAGSEALNGNYGRAAAALGAGTAETLGNIVGFGVGDGAREVVRGGIVATAGEKYAPEKSGLRQLGEGVLSVGSRFFGGDDDKPAQTASNRPRPKGPTM